MGMMTRGKLMTAAFTIGTMLVLLQFETPRAYLTGQRRLW